MSMLPPPTVIVTGASRGIGLATTKILLEQGAIVATLSRTRSPELTELLANKSSQLLVQDCDLADNEALETAISVILKTYQRLDAVVLNAGTIDPLERISDGNDLDGWKKSFDINFFSLVRVLQLVTKPLLGSQRGARVVFVSSGAANGGITSWGAYSASKAAMNSLCRTYANEQPDVTCVALRPGIVATEMQAAVRQRGLSTMKASEHSRFTTAYSTGTLLDPEVPGYVIASLALRAPRELSGSFVSWDADECKDFRKPA